MVSVHVLDDPLLGSCIGSFHGRHCDRIDTRAPSLNRALIHCVEEGITLSCFASNRRLPARASGDEHSMPRDCLTSTLTSPTLPHTKHLPFPLHVTLPLGVSLDEGSPSDNTILALADASPLNGKRPD